MGGTVECSSIRTRAALRHGEKPNRHKCYRWERASAKDQVLVLQEMDTLENETWFGMMEDLVTGSSFFRGKTRELCCWRYPHGIEQSGGKPVGTKSHHTALKCLSTLTLLHLARISFTFWKVADFGGTCCLHPQGKLHINYHAVNFTPGLKASGSSLRPDSVYAFPQFAK